MQSWGTQSRFSHRDTGLEPSKSGIVGILGAAIGVARDDESAIARLAELPLAVRVDQPGTMMRDYHTAMDVRKADGSRPPAGQAVLSERFYLADASFLAGIEADSDFLNEIGGALKDPVWPIFLGRKSFVPGLPLLLPDGGLREGKLLDVLAREPVESVDPDSSYRVVFDVPYGQGHPRQDVPVTFSPRKFRVRHVDFKFVNPPIIQKEDAA
jgi:CRISPR system Cascade subunit CasD